LRELEARIHIVERGKSKVESDTVTLHDLKFDLLGMKIFGKDTEIHGTAHEWIVLKLLLEHP
jgi:DNA-binding response OmpR family regulator